MSCNIQKRRLMAAAAQADLARTRDQADLARTRTQASNLQTPLQKMLAEREKQDAMWTDCSNQQNQECAKPTNSSKSIERHG